MKKRYFLSAVFFGYCALLFSCKNISPVDGIIIKGGGEFTAEQEFLEQLFLNPDFANSLGLRLIHENETRELAKDEQNSDSYKFLIEFSASWEQTDGILISRTWFAPKENPLNERVNAKLADCLDGSETLVPISEIAPPYTGLSVDGLSAADKNYPLVRHVSINIKIADNARKNNRLQKKITALEKVLAQSPKPLVHNAPSIVWICAAGDLMLDRGSGGILIDEGARGILGKTADYFIKSDINIVNLEGAVSDRGVKTFKSYNFRFNPQVVPPLKAAGINAVLLANNHIFDYGEIAFLDTLEVLEKNEIAILGAGRDIAAAASPFVFTTEQLEVRVFGIASFPRERTGWDGASVSATEERAGMLFASNKSVETLKNNFTQKENVLNVLLFHGGHEWTWKPEPGARRLYSELAHNGADLLIGSHPHTVQGFEWIDGKLIFWSLGNYVFAGMRDMYGGEEGLLIRLGYMGKTLIYFEPVPVRLNGPRSDIGSPDQLKRFYALSRELNSK